MGICDGRVVIVTGGGRGLGRAHSLAFAAEGANVVVNDLGASLTGDPTDESPGQEVVAEIVAAGGEAIVNGDDISDWDGAGRLVAQAIDTFGGLDTLVCNAGIVRDRMLVNMSVEEWDAVIRVHLRGLFCSVRHAVGYWRDEQKAERTRDPCILDGALAEEPTHAESEHPWVDHHRLPHRRMRERRSLGRDQRPGRGAAGFFSGPVRAVHRLDVRGRRRPRHRISLV